MELAEENDQLQEKIKELEQTIEENQRTIQELESKQASAGEKKEEDIWSFEPSNYTLSVDIYKVVMTIIILIPY